MPSVTSNNNTTSSSSNVIARYQWAEPKFGGLRNSFFHLLLRDYQFTNDAPDLMIPLSTVFEAGFPRFQFLYDPTTKEVRKETSGTLLQASALFSGILSSVKQFKQYCEILETKRKRKKKRHLMMTKRKRAGQTYSDLEKEEEDSNSEDDFVGLNNPNEGAGEDGGGVNENNSNGASSSPFASILAHQQEEEDAQRKNKKFSSDIIAVLIYSLPGDQQAEEDDPNDSIHHNKNKHTSTSTSSSRITRMEPMNEALLRKFLFESTPTDPRRQHAVLQQVLPPDEANFTVSRVSWSPSVTLVSRRQSKYPFFDQRYSPAQRMLLFDALQENSVEVHCAAKTGQEVEATCREVAKHVNRVMLGNNSSTSTNDNSSSSGHQQRKEEVVDMLLYLMTSAGGRQVLLWCGGFDVGVVEDPSTSLLFGGDGGGGGNATPTRKTTAIGTSPVGAATTTNKKKGGRSSTTTKLPASALEGGTVELLNPSEKAEQDELNRLDAIERSLEKEFFKKTEKSSNTSTSSPMKKKSSNSNNSSSSPNKKSNNDTNNNNIIRSPSSSPKKQDVNKFLSSPKNTTTVTNMPLSSSSTITSSSADLDQQIIELYNTKWRQLDPDVIPQYEENLRMAEHEIRLVLGSAIYDYFTPAAAAGIDDDDDEDNNDDEEERNTNDKEDKTKKEKKRRRLLKIETESVNDIDRLLSGGEEQRNDLFKTIGFTIHHHHQQQSIHNHDNHADFVVFEPIAPKTQNVMTSLMEVWLSNFFTKEMENLRQRYASKIREAATKIALGLPM